MSDANSISWSQLLQDKREKFAQSGSELSSTVTDEDSFRDCFEKLCKTNGESFYTRLLPKIRYDLINILANAVDAVVSPVQQDGLSRMVSAAMFVTARCTCEAGIPLPRIAAILGELNGAVPKLAPDILQFPHDASLHGALQKIFSTYIDSLLRIVKYTDFTDRPANFDLNQSIETCMKESANTFQSEEARFRQFLVQAARYEAASSYNPIGYDYDKSVSSSSSDGMRSQYEIQARFQFVRRLGIGASGAVDMLQEVSTGQVYARKQIYLPIPPHRAAIREEEIKNEFDVMKKLTHQHIVQVLFWLKDPEQVAYSIFMSPVADYTLFLLIERRSGGNSLPKSDPNSIISWFGCLLDALAFAHRLKIIHHDIKPTNILIKDEQVYLADFSLAKDFTSEGTSQTTNNSVHGTSAYRAPEVRPGSSRGRPADIFALGCVFSEMLTVVHGRSLETFRKFRQTPDSEGGGFAFRENLTKVREWLHQMEDEDSDYGTRPLIWETLEMLNSSPDRRPQAQKGVDFLKSQGEPLYFCDRH